MYTIQELSGKIQNMNSLNSLIGKANNTLCNMTVDISNLQRLHHDIHHNPQFNWNQKDTAQKLNISISYLKKLYRNTIGISFIDDIIMARIERTMLLLSTTDLRICEISE